jgi:hypothetical protein
MVDLSRTLVLFFGAETLLSRSEQTGPACQRWGNSHEECCQQKHVPHTFGG